jgi:hypothetical protein
MAASLRQRDNMGSRCTRIRQSRREPRGGDEGRHGLKASFMRQGVCPTREKIYGNSKIDPPTISRR